MDRDDKIIKFPSDFAPKKPLNLTSDEFDHLNAKLEALADELTHQSVLINKLLLNLKKLIKDKA